MFVKAEQFETLPFLAVKITDDGELKKIGEGAYAYLFEQAGRAHRFGFYAVAPQVGDYLIPIGRSYVLVSPSDFSFDFKALG